VPLEPDEPSPVQPPAGELDEGQGGHDAGDSQFHVPQSTTPAEA
jgi:hypothetical protein